MPGSEGADNDASLPDSPTELRIAMSAARLPLVKPYVEQLLEDALRNSPAQQFLVNQDFLKLVQKFLSDNFSMPPGND